MKKIVAITTAIAVTLTPLNVSATGNKENNDNNLYSGSSLTLGKFLSGEDAGNNDTIDNNNITSGISTVLGSFIDVGDIADIRDLNVPLSMAADISDQNNTNISDEVLSEDILEEEKFEEYTNEEVLEIYKTPRVRYVKCDKLNGRTCPNKSELSAVTETYKWNTKLTIYGEVPYTEWVYTFDKKGYMVYIDRNYLSKKKQHKPKKKKKVTTQTSSSRVTSYTWRGSRLNRRDGVNNGPSGRETYYNLPMQGVIRIMRAMGNNDRYWVRADGVKMLGDYVMVAADLRIRPRGSHVPTSLGMGVVVDTGTFIYSSPQSLDIATSW